MHPKKYIYIPKQKIHKNKTENIYKKQYIYIYIYTKYKNTKKTKKNNRSGYIEIISTNNKN